jgi:hypothetical protein
MKLGEFGGARSNSHSVGTITGWLERLISEEEEACEKSTSRHRKARLERAQEALEALYQVADWKPSLTQEVESRNRA